MVASVQGTLMTASIQQSLQSRRKTLGAVAQAWLNHGATAFAIADNYQSVQCWPPEADNEAWTMTAPLCINRQTVGELRVAGLASAECYERLCADAGLIGNIIELDQDLDSLTSELIDRQDELVALHNVTQSTRERIDLSRIAESVMVATTKVLRCEGAFSVVDSAELAETIFDQYPVAYLSKAMLKGWFNRVRDHGSEIVINKPTSEFPLPNGIRNLMIAPVRIHAEVVAVVGFINKHNGDFTLPNRKLIEAISQQIGSHIENTLLRAESAEREQKQREIQLARRVQTRLMPRQMPTVTGLDVAGFCQPALEVGGDFYAFARASDDRLMFTVGDVAGKGMPAALMMTMTYTTLRSIAKNDKRATPAAVIDGANTALYDDFTDVGMFATVFVGEYDNKKGLLNFANAGHSPVIYCPADGPPRMLEADGPAMGVLAWSLSEDDVLRFGAGDVLVVATDGFPETCNTAGEMFGYQRLLDVIDRSRQASADQIVTNLFEAIRRFGGHSSQDDDETIIVLKGVPS